MAVDASQPFFARELEHQLAWRDRTPTLDADARTGGRSERFLNSAYWTDNLFPGCREEVAAYLRRHRIKPHTMFAHLLSSQVFCLNFLGPFMARPEALADLLVPVLGERVLPVWLPGELGFVAFEWISDTDYLNEGGAKRQRGSRCTSVDAAVGLVRGGRRELLLIEWKYSESYGAPIANRRPSGRSDSPNEVRAGRYGERFEGLIADSALRLEDFFWEPFYQLLRQQMLAMAVEKDGSDPAADFDCVALAHVSPAANVALKRVTAPALRSHEAFGGRSACEGWAALLSRPDRYVPVAVETLFRAFPFERHPDLADWRDYMTDRYRFLG